MDHTIVHLAHIANLEAFLAISCSAARNQIGAPRSIYLAENEKESSKTLLDLALALAHKCACVVRSGVLSFDARLRQLEFATEANKAGRRWLGPDD
jgi:hypothetical protein